MTTQRKKPFQKGHLTSHAVHLSDLQPDARKRAGTKSRNARRLRTAVPNPVYLDWKAPTNG